MKRAAENQLSRFSDGEDDEPEPQQGTQRASDAVLATRVIRKLPSRTGSGTNVTAPAPVPTLSGGLTNGSIANNASSTAKAFAGFINPPSPFPAAPAPAPAPVTNGVKDSDALEKDRCLNLAGLNRSFTEIIEKHLEVDKTADIDFYYAQYKVKRAAIEKEYTDARAAGSFAAAVSMPQLPTPPTSFAGFKPLTTAPSSSSPSGGFTPTFSTTSTPSTSAFSFASPSATSISSKSSPFSVKPPSDSPTFSTSIFGSSSSTSGSSLLSKPDSSSPFGTSTTTSTTPNFFKTDSQSAFVPPTNVPDNPFAPKLDSGSNSSKALASTPTSSATNIFAIGSEAKSAGPTPAVTPTSSFTFGSSTTVASSSVFGKPTGGTFAGFGGFGSTSSLGGGGSSVGFGFGTVLKSEASESQESRASTESLTQDESQEGEAKADAASMFITPSVHDQEGEGEEDEETVHSIKLKVYKLKKNSEGPSTWADMGAGVLRLKKHKSEDTRRILLRNSNTGKININFNLNGGENPQLTKTSVIVAGQENGHPQAYNLRTKTVDQAQDLKTALDREIAFVKAKAS